MIRTAGSEDIIHAADIFTRIIDHEERNGKFTAFQRGVYPTYATAKEAFDDDSLYVYDLNGDICACLIMDMMQPKEYTNIVWTFDDAAVIHLLCVRPDKCGMGLGHMMLAFAVEEARRLGCRSIRLDTGEQNTPARRLYESFGFTLAGSGSMSIGGAIPHDNHLFYEMRISEDG